MLRRWLLALILLAPLSLEAKPIARFEHTQADFGFISQGKKARVSFSFRNAGDQPLKILSIHTTCGCTAAAPAKPELAPGEKGEITVTFDSRGKIGETNKIVRVAFNDPERPMVNLTITGRVGPSAHPEMTGTKNLFQGSCADCHARPGEGKKGAALYMASCAMCHENHKRGGHFIARSGEELAATPPRQIKKSLVDGVPGSSMPAFSLKHEGPLTNAQIRSLVKYLKSLKK